MKFSGLLAAAILAAFSLAGFAREEKAAKKPKEPVSAPEFLKICKGDIRNFCRSLPPRDALKIAYCLGQHDVELTDNCRDVMEAGNDWTKPSMTQDDQDD